MLLIDYARELGLPCRGRVQGDVVTWTTSRDKADTVRRAGASYRTVETTSGRIIGYEVQFPPDKDVTEGVLRP